MGQEWQSGAARPLNVLVLYDSAAVYTNTVREHLNSFARFSRHRVAYAPAPAGVPLTFSLDPFDVVILHYSIRLAFDWHLSAEFAWALKRFDGLKVAFLQDEYDHTWRACQWIDQLGVRLVFTCVPPQHVRAIYSKVDHNRVMFEQTLTGYLPMDADLSKHIRPLAERRVVIGYRGRALPFRYGRLAREKLMIGVRMREECQARGIPCDIEWTEDKRIYGDAWMDFVGSCRASLGTESGSNVFDFDGTLTAEVNAALKGNPRLTFAEVEKRFLRGREMDGVMNQVSPRIFEAVALQTGLILFEGRYSGVVRPDEHFIPLRKDFSNVDEVLRRVRDDRELSAMIDRAHREVIGSGAYTYAAFVRGVDAALDRHAGSGRSAELPAAGPWLREVPAPSSGGVGLRARVRRTPGLGPVARAAFHVARGVYIGLGLRAARRRLRPYGGATARGAKALIQADPELTELLGNVPAPNGRGRLAREVRRLALLRHLCKGGPTVFAPVWATIEFDPDRGRLTFTSRPAHDLPGVIRPGQAILERALKAVRSRAVREVVWDVPHGPLHMEVKLDKVGVVRFPLGPDRSFRFTALERLADLDPERAARVVAHVAEGASAPPAPAAEPGEAQYRRAS
jgi:hypothetical protein